VAWTALLDAYARPAGHVQNDRNACSRDIENEGPPGYVDEKIEE
jgi:hypothetical protein